MRAASRGKLGFVMASESAVQMRQPRLAEMIADVLRARILAGVLGDGNPLPKQDDLIKEFHVSRPSAREAIGILEAEGLITVRRGKVGGAVVHQPKASGVAYMLGLVLQSQNATLQDVGLALQAVEPMCAALCAGRSDRRKAVVPALRTAHHLFVDAVERDDSAGATAASRTFHEGIVAMCGNDSLIVVIGALETIWTANEKSWAERLNVEGRWVDWRPDRTKAVEEHDEILTQIDAGDSVRADAAVRQHLETAQRHLLSDVHVQMIEADALRLST
jgi:GntR family transcriptional regulator, transcriptional repressor for pyruvate dehydrogenase complex